MFESLPTGHWPLRPRPLASPRPVHVPRLSRIMLLAGLVLAVAACSAAPSGSGVVSLQSPPSATANPSALPSAPADPQDAMQAFAKCMRDHGVNVQVSSVGATTGSGGVVISGNAGPASSGKPASGGQAPQANGQNTTPEQMQQAQQACQSLMPKPAAQDPNATPDPKLVEQLLAFSKCMRDHGIDYPDPQFQGGAVTMSIGGPNSNVDPTSTKFQDAQKACSASLPGGGPMTIGGAPNGSGSGSTSGGSVTIP